jgi:hypothetical protein
VQLKVRVRFWATDLCAPLTIGYMHESISASAFAASQFLKGIVIAVVFVAVYVYWRWLPQPHSF